MKNIKKYEIAKWVCVCSAVLFAAFIVFMYAYVFKLPTEQAKSLAAFLNENPIVLRGAGFIFILPFSVALFSFGLMLKYKESRYMVLRIPLYFVAVCFFAGMLLQLVFAI